MPHKDPEARKAYMRERYLRKAEEIKAYQKQYRAENKTKIYEARKEYLAAWHRANGERRRRKTNQMRLNIKAKLVLFYGGQCVVCTYEDHLAAMEFHHRDPATKEFELNMNTIATRPWDELLIEADKCDLLCSNCHAELHAMWDEEMLELAMKFATEEISNVPELPARSRQSLAGASESPALSEFGEVA